MMGDCIRSVQRRAWQALRGGWVIGVGLLGAIALGVAHPHSAPLFLMMQTDDVVAAASAPRQVSAQSSSMQQGQPGLPATQQIQRLNQLDPGQYASNAEYQQWSASACSAAAMAEVFNAYGRHYRISDVLHMEQRLAVISPELGLLSARGIALTATQLGFVASWGQNWSLSQLLAATQQGHPVIISFPPDRFPGGHLLVVRGGDASSIWLIDSSRLNLTSLSRGKFLQLWRGFAAVLTPASSTPFQAPTISAVLVEQVLQAYHSPAAGSGQSLWQISIRYGIDPAFALGFFAEESRFGTKGVARITRSLGNLRCLTGVPCVNGYAAFASWNAGYEAWARLLAGPLYEGAGIYDLPALIHRYAPAADQNDERAYVATVLHVVNRARAGHIDVLS